MVRFVVRSAELHILHPLRLEPGGPPRDVVFRCRPRDLRTLDGMLAGGTLHLTLYADDSPVALVSFVFTALTPEYNRSLRAPGRRRAVDYASGTAEPYEVYLGNLGLLNETFEQLDDGVSRPARKLCDSIA